MEPKTKICLTDYAPKNFLLWFCVFCCFLLAKLPYDLLLNTGKNFSYLFFYKLNIFKRREVCENNLRLVYPNWTELQINQTTKAHFKSVGIGIAETIFSWWGHFPKISERWKLVDRTNLDRALAKNKGVILWWAHFTTMDISGRIIASEYPLITVYKRNRKKIVDKIENFQRDKYRKGKIASDNIKQMLNALKEGEIIWYSSDQSFTEKGYVKVPLFNVAAASNTATGRIAKISQAPVIPFTCVRQVKKGKYYYTIKFLPENKTFPTGKAYDDIRYLHSIIESQMQDSFVDYFWLHRRWREPPKEFKG